MSSDYGTDFLSQKTFCHQMSKKCVNSSRTFNGNASVSGGTADGLCSYSRYTPGSPDVPFLPRQKLGKMFLWVFKSGLKFQNGGVSSKCASFEESNYRELQS